MSQRYSSLNIATDTAISRQIDSKYDNVKTVADNIVDVVTVATALDNGDFDIVSTNVGFVTTVANELTSTDNLETIGIDLLLNENSIINTVGTDLLLGIDSNIFKVADDILKVISVADDLVKIDSVADDLVRIDNVADIIIPVLPEILDADNNAAIATAQAIISTDMATTSTEQAVIATGAASDALASSLLVNAYGNIDWAGFTIIDGELVIEYFNSSTSIPSLVDGELILTY